MAIGFDSTDDLPGTPEPKQPPSFRAVCIAGRQYGNGTKSKSWDAGFEIVDDNHISGQLITISGVGDLPYRITSVYSFIARKL